MPWSSQRSAFASFDAANRAWVNAKLYGNFSIGTVCGFYLVCLRFCKFCMSMSFAKSMAALISGVIIIISMRSRLKMIWIHARRIIARMQQYFSFWYFANNQFVTNAMSTYATPILMSSNANRSIASSIRISEPKPTRISFIDLRPKSFFESMKNLLFWLGYPPLLVMRSTKRAAYCWLSTFYANFSHGLLCHEVVG